MTFPVPLPVAEAVVTVGGADPGVTAEKEEVAEEEVEEGGWGSRTSSLFSPRVEVGEDMERMGNR